MSAPKDFPREVFFVVLRTSAGRRVNFEIHTSGLAFSTGCAVGFSSTEATFTGGGAHAHILIQGR
jgi:hypothetical protein